MSFLHRTSLIHGLNLSHSDDSNILPQAGSKPAGRQLRATSSLANLIHFARNPVEIASEAIEDWYDGSTKQERTQRQTLADRKQLLRLKMRTAGSPVPHCTIHSLIIYS